MKKITITALASLLFITGCQNDDGEKEQGAAKIDTSEEAKETKKKDDEKKSEAKKVTPKKETAEKEKKTEKSSEDKESVKAVDSYSFVTTDGKVDITSPDFINYYFSSNHRFEFANIKAGMTRSAVEAVYGESQGTGAGAQSPMGEKYGDIVVVYDADDLVEYIMLNPSQGLTEAEVKGLYGEPTYDGIKAAKEGPPGAYMPEYVYDGNKTNGYAVVAMFSSGDNKGLRLIETLDHDSSTKSNNTQASKTETDDNKATDKYIQDTEKALVQFEADSSNEELKKLLWAHIIRGRSPFSKDTDEATKKVYTNQFNRYVKVNPEAEQYRWLIEEPK